MIGVKMVRGARHLESEGDQAHETSKSGAGQGSDLASTSSGNSGRAGRGGGVDTTSRRDCRCGRRIARGWVHRSRVNSSVVGRRISRDGERRVGWSTAAAAAAIQESAYHKPLPNERSLLPGGVDNGRGGVDRHADSAGAVGNGQCGGLYISCQSMIGDSHGNPLCPFVPSPASIRPRCQPGQPSSRVRVDFSHTSVTE